MKIVAKIKANAKVEQIEKIGENEFRISVKAPPKEGKANRSVVELISEYYHIPKSNIEIIKGLTSKTKVIEIS